jgi:thiamine biosynthesis protein ThiS
VRVFVNGEAIECGATATIDSLLRAIGAERERVAVMVNERVVARAERSAVAIRDGDRIEVLQFCGGG